MLDNKKIEQSSYIIRALISDGKIVTPHSGAASFFLKQSRMSLLVSKRLLDIYNTEKLETLLWVINSSYYSMFYVANDILLKLGYKTQDKIVHKVTCDALIVLVLSRLSKELVENYESIQNDALEIASIKAEEIIADYESELGKRGRFQYNMLEQTKESKALTSLQRAKEFLFEMRKLLK